MDLGPSMPPDSGPHSGPQSMPTPDDKPPSSKVRPSIYQRGKSKAPWIGVGMLLVEILRVLLNHFGGDGG